LSHEFLVRVVPIIDSGVGDAGREQRLDGTEQRDRDCRLNQLIQCRQGECGQCQCGNILWDAAKFRADGFHRKREGGL